MDKKTMRSSPITSKLLVRMAKQALISPDDVEALIENQKSSDKSFEVLLLSKELIGPSELIRFLSKELGCTPVNFNMIEIDESITKLIPSQIAHARGVIPISIKGKVLTVALENPSDLTVIDDVKAITGLRIKPVIALSHGIDQALQKYYPDGGESGDAAAGQMMDELVRIVHENKEDDEAAEGSLLRLAQETPVIKITNLLILDAIKREASDLFIEPWEHVIRVRCRVDGILEEVASPPKAMHQAIVSRFKVLSHLNIAERRIPQDGRFKIKVSGRSIDLRLSIIPTSYGEKVCIRILDNSATAAGLDKLGFSERELSIIKECSAKPHGMMLVTGPTGSGKTTTLYSVLKSLDSEESNITTVEDPVEYETDGINQVNVKDSVGLTFPAALRSILRQDPDIILIGEIRDLTTMDIAIKAALTGHLVLSTLHTNDTVGAIVRMRNMGIEPFLITSSVLMVTAQRLLRKLCNSCKVPYEADEKMLRRMNVDIKSLAKGEQIYQAVGCKKCRQVGYSGRTVITELLPMSGDIRDLIIKNKTGKEIKTAACALGTTTLRQSGLRRALSGLTTLEEVLRLTADDFIDEVKRKAA